MEKIEKYELEDAYDEIAEKRKCGMRSVLTHIENLRSEMKRKCERSPIEAVTSRIKLFPSALEKCERKGFEPSIESFEEMHDIAGVRIIVPFLDDICRVKEAITRRKNLEVVEERDYIKNRKPSGYRSYHLIVKTKISYEFDDDWPLVEIQIRTKAQDFWSSMEHKLRYKNRNPAPAVVAEMASFSDELYEKDKWMVHMRDYNKIESIVGDENEESIAGMSDSLLKLQALKHS